MISGFNPARFIASLITSAPKSITLMSFKDPLKFPTAVRAPLTITASVIKIPPTYAKSIENSNLNFIICDYKLIIYLTIKLLNKILYPPLKSLPE